MDLSAAVRWIRNNTQAGGGIHISSRQRVCYPEVTGYFIPTLLSVGEHDLARQYARWLVGIQSPDGSFALNGDAFAFDTGQVIRGWTALLPRMPELEQPLRKACSWIMQSSDPRSARLRVPPPNSAWSLGPRGEVSEGIHLYALAPMRKAGELLGDRAITQFVERSVPYYISNVSLTDFTQTHQLTHFYAYVQEALVELGYEDLAHKGMTSVSLFQRENGAVPAYSNVSWVCTPGLAQLAKVWYALGERSRAERAMTFLSQFQNPSGGFFGSYGVEAGYFPAEEISWAVKYSIEASALRIADHFDASVTEYQNAIPNTDGRVTAVLTALGNISGKRILDAGCGKGRYAAILKNKFPDAEITGMDVSEEMLSHVPRGIARVQSSILEAPFADASFDAILCIEALEHVVHIDAAIRQFARLLAPGGTLIIIDKNREKLGALEMPSWERWFGQDELEQVIRNAGMSVSSGFVSYEHHTVPDGLFICWTARKSGPDKVEPRVRVEPQKAVSRLAVIPSDPLDAYSHKSEEYLQSYFNPGGFFDEVYCLSPVEKKESFRYGMFIIPTDQAQLAARIRKLGISCVRAYGAYWPSDMAVVGKVPGVPVIVSVHDTNPELLHPSVREADHVLPVSKAVQDALLQFGVPAERIHPFTNRVNLDQFTPVADATLRAAFERRYPGKYRVLHVGRKTGQKNPDTVIRALAQLGPEYVGIFIGKGDDEEYRSLARSLGISDRCIFEQSVDHAQLPQYYSFCDCLCTPSRWEGFGMIFIEALACEGIVITSDRPPMNELITNRSSGLLVKKFEDPSAIARAIVTACTDNELRERIKQHARAAAEPFRKETVDALEISLYRKFLGKEELPEGGDSPHVQQEVRAQNPWYTGSHLEWAEKPSIKRIYQKRFDFIAGAIRRQRERLRRPLRVLDAGCGDGYWLARLSALEGVQITGVEYNSLRVERARTAAPGAVVHHGDITSLHPDEPFDLILLNQVIEHIRDDRGTLRTIRSLLQKDGVLVLGTPNEGSWLHAMRQKRLGDRFKTDHVHFYTEEEIRRVIGESGFTIENSMREVFYIGDDDVSYQLLEQDWGFELLEFLTFLVPSGTSDYYFECRPGRQKGEPFYPLPPSVGEIQTRLREFAASLGKGKG